MHTMADVAERFNVHVQTVSAWIKSGAIVATDVSLPGARRPTYRVSEDAVRAFEKSRQTKPARASQPRAPRGRYF